MTEYKKLSQSRAFQAALAVPIVCGLSLFLAALTANENYKICFTSACIELFFNLYKYPISILGLAVPLSAIVAAIHRSNETAYQIKLTLSQNTFNNYTKHQEEFSKLLKELESLYDCKFSQPAALYKKIFPSNSYHSFSSVAHDEGAELLNKLREGVIQSRRTTYSEKATDNELINCISELYEISSTLTLLPTTPDPERDLSQYCAIVWPTNYCRTTHSHLIRILKRISIFSSHTFSPWPADSTRDNTDPSKASAIKAANQAKIDSFVKDY
ncbi:hypothetical protein [Pseudomonas mosselii]|uniref:Uncharacterized protein n=1 Tax=Pseudomonas mosselii TaxID=78327 RepID=A0AA42S009_9PSED|nr:hypothetical protein [Pseudomonas mosselii]MDH1632415.1 hypothetical protein [Pseudomonas mosselii]